jgi:hypothetical protein
LRIVVYVKYEHVLDIEHRERHVAHDALVHLDASLDE